jgi:type I restriction enzyme, S subunit
VYKYITAKNIRPSGLDLGNVAYVSEAEHRTIYERCDPKKGDVLLVKDGVNTGDAAMNTLEEEFSLLSSVCLIRPYEDVIYGPYVRYFLLSPAGYSLLTGQMTGTAIKRIILRRIRELSVPVAPLLEQHRIVAAIEEQLSRLDAGVATLERVQTNLKHYRTAVLKAAVKGRLTESWREENPDVEPAAELHERILKERRRRWEEDQLATYEKKGKKPPKNWRSKYKEPPGPTEELPQLPMGWTWSTLEQLTWHSGYGTSQKCSYEAPGPPVLRIPNIVGGSIDLSDLKFGSRPAQFESMDSLSPNDMLVVRTNGSRNLIGRAAVVRGELEREYYFASYLIRFRVVDIPGLPEWLATAWDAPSTRRHIEQVAATSAGQYNVNISKLNNVPIPLPPLGEQTAVVEEVKLRRSVLDEVEAEVEANVKRASRLRQSILKRAFEGKLVPQDPSDEPASELLARIKAERERSSHAKRRKKRQDREEPAEAQAGLF